MAQQNPSAGSARQSAGTVISAPKSAPRHQPPRPARRQLPPFKLILHNDEVNIMEDVVEAIVRIVRLSAGQAELRMWEAHRTGQSLLLVTHRERGELYVQQFASARITTSLEPDA